MKKLGKKKQLNKDFNKINKVLVQQLLILKMVVKYIWKKKRKIRSFSLITHLYLYIDIYIYIFFSIFLTQIKNHDDSFCFKE